MPAPNTTARFTACISPCSAPQRGREANKDRSLVGRTPTLYRTESAASRASSYEINRKISGMKQADRRRWPGAKKPVSQSEPLPRHQAGIVAGLARAANIRSDAVNCAGGGDADLAHQGGAAIAVAPHAAEIGVVLQGEARPLA